MVLNYVSDYNLLKSFARAAFKDVLNFKKTKNYFVDD
jgi:hypothetical protein